MTEAETNTHLAERRAKAQRFIDQPEAFKVCDLCSSISYNSAGVCGVCGGYCWHTDAETVVATARVIGSTPFPQTSGTVPRVRLDLKNN